MGCGQFKVSRITCAVLLPLSFFSNFIYAEEFVNPFLNLNPVNLHNNNPFLEIPSVGEKNKVEARESHTSFASESVGYNSSEGEKESLVDQFLDQLIATASCPEETFKQNIYHWGGMVARFGRLNNKISKTGIDFVFLEKFSEQCQSSTSTAEEEQDCLERVFPAVKKLTEIIWNGMREKEKNASGISEAMDQKWASMTADANSDLNKAIHEVHQAFYTLKASDGIALKCENTAQKKVELDRFPKEGSNRFINLPGEVLMNPILRGRKDEVVKYTRTLAANDVSAGTIENSFVAYYTYTDPEYVFSRVWNMSDDKKKERIKYYKDKAKKIKNQNVLTLVDYTKHSKEDRLFVLNLVNGDLTKMRTAHGSSSDLNHDGYVDENRVGDGKNQSAGGAYVTGKSYNGKLRYSMKLDGLEGKNDNAMDRGVIIHADYKHGDYVGAKFISQNNKCGRSQGCFTVAQGQEKWLIDTTKEGSLWYVHINGHPFEL